MAESISDRELVDRVERYGDEDAFRRLYRRHTPYLLRFVFRLQARSETEAEDIVQETWVRAATTFDRFRWDSTLRTWLGAIALHLTRDALRRSGRDATGPGTPNPAVPPPSVLERLDLERAIAQLADGYRTVFVLHDVEGFTHVEIAERLGIEPVSSRTQLSRARAALRAILAKDSCEARAGAGHGPRRKE